MQINSLDSVELYGACRSSDTNLQSAAYEALWKYLYARILYFFNDQPDADKVAQDCCQDALIRIYERLDELREPAAFLGWARRIAINLAKDEIKKRSRFYPIDDIEESSDLAVFIDYNRSREGELRRLINIAPISELSRRVVVARYLDDRLDEELAASESELQGRRVLPSHVQVTRSKDIARLRSWDVLLTFLTG